MAARLFDEAEHLTEAEPRAFANLLRREERIESPAHDFGRHAHARIGDRRSEHIARQDLDMRRRVSFIEIGR